MTCPRCSTLPFVIALTVAPSVVAGKRRVLRISFDWASVLLVGAEVLPDRRVTQSLRWEALKSEASSSDAPSHRQEILGSRQAITFVSSFHL